MINYLKSMLYTTGVTLVSTLILTILNYFNILNGIIFKIVCTIIPLLGVFIGSFTVGKQSNQKGYIEGLKYGIIWTILLLIINLITKNFTLLSIVYYIILILISMFAGVLGINTRKK